MKEAELNKLKSLYEKAKRIYYNDPNGKQLMTDAQFDKLEDKLKRLDPKWKGFKAGSPVVKKLKAKLPVPIFSLDKVKTEKAIQAFLSEGDYVVVMDKLDGSSLELVYEGGKPTRLFTRGDGKIGGEVSFLIPYLRGIPQKVSTKSRVIVRCEGLFTKAAFDKHKHEFDAARNAASGILNRQDIHKAVKDLSVVALQMLEPNVKMSQGLKWLKSNGFRTVAWKVFPAAKLNFNNLSKLLQKRKSVGNFQMDGLVLVYDEKNVLPKSGNPDWGVAFKENVSVENAPVTTVRKVHWKISPHGVIIPRVEFDPIDMDGAKVKFATAFHAKFVMRNKIGPGAKVAIVRSGDIIPQIVKVVKTGRESLPLMSEVGDYTWDKTKTNIVLVDAKNNENVRMQKIARCFAKLDIDFIRGGVVKKMYAAGFDNIRKILKAKPADFERIEGVKSALANKMWTAIHSKTDNGVPLTQLMDASGVFPRGVSQTRLDLVAEKLNLMMLAKRPVDVIVQRISSLPGFQETTARMIAKGLVKFEKWCSITGLKINDALKPKAVKVQSNKLKGLNVTWTGYRNADQEQAVQSFGGNVVSFGSKTQVLLVSPTGKTSGKADKARERQIPVMTWSEFSKKYGVSE